MSRRFHRVQQMLARVMAARGTSPYPGTITVDTRVVRAYSANAPSSLIWQWGMAGPKSHPGATGAIRDGQPEGGSADHQQPEQGCGQQQPACRQQLLELCGQKQGNHAGGAMGHGDDRAVSSRGRQGVGRVPDGTMPIQPAVPTRAVLRLQPVARNSAAASLRGGGAFQGAAARASGAGEARSSPGWHDRGEPWEGRQHGGGVADGQGEGPRDPAGWDQEPDAALRELLGPWLDGPLLSPATTDDKTQDRKQRGDKRPDSRRPCDRAVGRDRTQPDKSQRGDSSALGNGGKGGPTMPPWSSGAGGSYSDAPWHGASSSMDADVAGGESWGDPSSAARTSHRLGRDVADMAGGEPLLSALASEIDGLNLDHDASFWKSLGGGQGGGMDVGDGDFIAQLSGWEYEGEVDGNDGHCDDDGHGHGHGHDHGLGHGNGDGDGCTRPDDDTGQDTGQDTGDYGSDERGPLGQGGRGEGSRGGGMPAVAATSGGGGGDIGGGTDALWEWEREWLTGPVTGEEGLARFWPWMHRRIKLRAARAAKRERMRAEAEAAMDVHKGAVVGGKQGWGEPGGACQGRDERDGGVGLDDGSQIDEERDGPQGTPPWPSLGHGSPNDRRMAWHDGPRARLGKNQVWHEVQSGRAVDQGGNLWGVARRGAAASAPLRQGPGGISALLRECHTPQQVLRAVGQGRAVGTLGPHHAHRVLAAFWCLGRRCDEVSYRPEELAKDRRGGPQLLWLLQVMESLLLPPALGPSLVASSPGGRSPVGVRGIGGERGDEMLWGRDMAEEGGQCRAAGGHGSGLGAIARSYLNVPPHFLGIVAYSLWRTKVLSLDVHSTTAAAAAAAATVRAVRDAARRVLALLLEEALRRHLDGFLPRDVANLARACAAAHLTAASEAAVVATRAVRSHPQSSPGHLASAANSRRGHGTTDRREGSTSDRREHSNTGLGFSYQGHGTWHPWPASDDASHGARHHDVPVADAGTRRSEKHASTRHADRPLVAEGSVTLTPQPAAPADATAGGEVTGVIAAAATLTRRGRGGGGPRWCAGTRWLTPAVWDGFLREVFIVEDSAGDENGDDDGDNNCNNAGDSDDGPAWLPSLQRALLLASMERYMLARPLRSFSASHLASTMRALATLGSAGGSITMAGGSPTTDDGSAVAPRCGQCGDSEEGGESEHVSAQLWTAVGAEARRRGLSSLCQSKLVDFCWAHARAGRYDPETFRIFEKWLRKHKLIRYVVVSLAAHTRHHVRT
eukprot:jgi/Mesvir1/10819/Mv07748-RA.2